MTITRRTTHVLDAVDLRDVRVAERTEHLGLALEAAPAIGVGRNGGGQDLEGDVALESRVAGAKDLTHAASPDQTDHVVRPNPSSGGECHEAAILRPRAYAKPASHRRGPGVSAALSMTSAGACSRRAIQRNGTAIACRTALPRYAAGYPQTSAVLPRTGCITTAPLDPGASRTTAPWRAASEPITLFNTPDARA